MFPQHGAPMAPPQKPETFMLSNEAQQSLPHDAQVALQQVDNCKSVAVSEPALSFEFDSSQSLYEQLTKAQQANSSSFTAHASTTYGQSASPVVRTVDAMPPPQMAPQMAPPTISLLPDESGSPAIYNPIPMPNTLAQSVVKRELDYGSIQYDRNGMPIARVHQRHASMPTFVEYSPAPSFVSSQYEDYSNRGLSFEPVTPPQHSVPLGTEPAYIANEDTGLYTAIPEISAAAFNPMLQLPPSNLASAHFPAPARTFHSNVYSVLEGSPTYKQRRRRSSIPPGVNNPIATPTHTQAPGPSQPIAYAAHRPSDLRRSVSSSVAPVAETEEPRHESSRRIMNGYPTGALPQKNLLHEMSRNGTPLSSLEENPEQAAMPLANPPDELTALPNGDVLETGAQHSAMNKAERHRRIHEAQQDGQQPLHVQDEDLENEDNELGSQDEGSSPSESIPSTVVNVSTVTSMPSTMTLPSAMPTMMAPHMVAPQLLQQQM
ncbi:unnamed protein product [Aspergillus oryzae]|uniref:Unnamed protein product n=1 Tax=Aspergillus oryzae var. brunneus TaxID=332754 RepID=A0ABQ6KLX2_ASPOZ|nr:unnamed protein product [Aspergillus oryzae]GMF92525.1 unnamed protein product [Aspergillus oryzae]GMG46250.1 unnamed protein product [Aspergillus oryzae var. brunneus]